MKTFLTDRGVSYTENNDGSLTFTIISSLYTNPLQFSQEDTTVSLSGIVANGTSNNARIHLLNSSNQNMGNIREGSTTLENVSACKLRFDYNSGGSGTVTMKNIQLEKGEPTPYEAHQEQIVYFPLAEGQKLYEGSYLADDGIHNVRGQIVFDGSSDENWIKGSYPRTGTVQMQIQKPANFFTETGATAVAKLNCSHFKSENQVVNGMALGGMFNVYPSTDLSITTAAEFKTWLSNNPMTLEYPLAEEEIIPYNTEQQAAWNSIRELHTYKTVTHIYSDAYAEIGYIKDNMLSGFETKASANLKYTETTEKFAQQKITNESIENTVSQTVTTVANNYNELKTKFDDYAPKSDVISLQTSVNQIMTDTYTKTEINEKLTDGSVTKVSTTAGTFDSNGLTIEKTDAKTKGNFNHEGIKVIDTTSGSNQELLFAGYDEEINETIVRTNNLTVNKYFTLKNVSRQEKYVNPVLGGKGIGTFIL